MWALHYFIFTDWSRKRQVASTFTVMTRHRVHPGLHCTHRRMLYPRERSRLCSYFERRLYIIEVFSDIARSDWSCDRFARGYESLGEFMSNEWGFTSFRGSFLTRDFVFNFRCCFCLAASVFLCPSIIPLTSCSIARLVTRKASIRWVQSHKKRRHCCQINLPKRIRSDWGLLVSRHLRDFKNNV